MFVASGKPAKIGADGKWSALNFTLPPECATPGFVVSAGEVAAFGQSGNKGSPLAFFRRSADTFSLLHTASTKTVLARLRISPDGQRVVTCNSYNTIEVFDVETGRRLCECDGARVRSISDLGWLGHDRLVGIGTRGDRGQPAAEEWIILWDAATGRVLRETRHSTAMDQLATAPDGRTFAEGGEDKRVRIRDAQTLEVLREFRAHDGAISALAFHPTKPVLASAAMDFTVRLWNPADASLIEELRLSSAESARACPAPGRWPYSSLRPGACSVLSTSSEERCCLALPPIAA